MQGTPCSKIYFAYSTHVMISKTPLAFAVYLIVSTIFKTIQSASLTSDQEKDKLSFLEARMKLLKMPFMDATETFEEYQETGPFRVSRFKMSPSPESLNSAASSRKYSPLARLALSNSQRDSFVAIQGDEVSMLVSGAEEESDEITGDEDMDSHNEKHDYSEKLNVIDPETNSLKKKSIN